MAKIRSLSYNSIPVVSNVRFADSFRITIPSKFKKLLITFGFVMIISVVFWVFGLLSGETASAGTIDFDNLEGLNYKVINEDGSIAKLSDSHFSEEFDSLNVGGKVSKFPISSDVDRLRWINNLLEEEKKNQALKSNIQKDKLLNILGSKSRVESVLKYSKEYGLPLYLVVGVIFAESSNNPNAISRVGARGLMQLMPDTAVLIARKMGLSKVALSIRKNARYLNKNEDINIKFGCAHLRDLYVKTRSWKDSVHAYNQGYARFIKGYRSNKYVNNVFRYWRYYENKEF